MFTDIQLFRFSVSSCINFFVWVFLKFVHFIEIFGFVDIEMSLFYRYPLSVGFVMIIFCHFLILVLIFTSVHVFFCFNSQARSLSILLIFSRKQALSLSFSLLSVLYFIGFCSFYFLLFSSFGFTLLLFF